MYSCVFTHVESTTVKQRRVINVDYICKSTHNSTLIQRLQNDLNSPMLKVKTGETMS